MNKKFAKLGGFGLSAVLAAAALAIVPATAASAAIVPTVGSAHPFYLISDEDGLQIAPGSVKGWNDSVLGSPEASDEDWNSNFPVPAGAGSVRTFISPRGQETNQAAWNASGPLALTPSGIQLPNLKPSGNTQPGTGSPSGSGAVANAGGDYSLGIAFLNGSAVVEASFTYITVVANARPELATWTFATPAAPATAPEITTTTLNAAIKGTAFSQTIASTGTAPITWTVQTGALPAGLGLDAATGVISGTPTAAGAYSFTLRATNSAGNDDQSFSGAVGDVAPTEPSGSAPNKVTIADPAEGVDTITVPAGIAHANQTLRAWAWSDPTDLGSVQADADGDVTVDISALPAGTHTIALTLPGDATFTVLAWGEITIASEAGDPIATDVDLEATVTASDLWSLNAEKTAIDFGDVRRNATATQSLGKVTVIDDRNVLSGWELDAAWSAFTNGTDSIATSALTIVPKAYAGSTLIPGVTLGTTAGAIAESTAVSTLATGALFDADLTFTAPKDAAVGEYRSTLTLTLTSK